jgi:hypothetical protein
MSNLTIVNWCPGDKCDPCAAVLFGILGTTSDGINPNCVYFHVTGSSPPDQLAVSATISMIGATPSIRVSGTLAQDLPGSTNWVAYPALPFTPIYVPSGFDYNHIRMHLDWITRPISPDPPHNPATFEWGTLGITFDAGIHHNYGYTVV